MLNDGDRLVAGKYRLERVLGQGGMGAVWRAHDEVLGRDVAVKEVRLPSGGSPQDAASWNARMLREARSAARLRHPGIINVHDVVQHDGRPWIVMELVEGQALDAVIKDGPPQAPEHAARIGLRVLDALRTAHAAGIVHRDIKPANILLDGERVVVTDFGIARVDDDTALTRTGTILGTPAYMSPEQASGRPVTPASDLWSLGATLYALVEGRPPFTGPNTAAVTAAILTQEPDPPRRAGSLAGVLAGLLVKDPARRMTADQAAAGLAAVAAAHPAAAPAAGHPAAGQGAGPQPTVPPGFLGTMRDAFQGRPVPTAVIPRRRTSRTAWVVAAAIVVVLAVAGYFIVDAVRGSGNHARLTRLAASIGSPPGFTREGSHDEAGGKLRLDYTRHCSNCKPTVLHDVLRWLATQPGVQQVAAPANDCAAPAGCGWQWSRDSAHVEVGFVTVSDEAYSLRVTLK